MGGRIILGNSSSQLSWAGCWAALIKGCLRNAQIKSWSWYHYLWGYPELKNLHNVLLITVWVKCQETEAQNIYFLCGVCSSHSAGDSMRMVVLKKHSMGFGTFSFNTLLPIHGHICPTSIPLSSSKVHSAIWQSPPFSALANSAIHARRRASCFSQPAPATPTLLCWSPTPTPLKRPCTWAVPRTCPFLPSHKCQNVWELGAGRGGKMGRDQSKTSWLLAPIFPQVGVTCVQKEIY